MKSFFDTFLMSNRELFQCSRARNSKLETWWRIVDVSQLKMYINVLHQLAHLLTNIHENRLNETFESHPFHIVSHLLNIFLDFSSTFSSRESSILAMTLDMLPISREWESKWKTFEWNKRNFCEFEFMCVDDFDWLWNFPLFNFSSGIFPPENKIVSTSFSRCLSHDVWLELCDIPPRWNQHQKSEEGTSELKWEILKWKKSRHENATGAKLAKLRHSSDCSAKKKRIEKLSEQLSSTQPVWNILKQVKRLFLWQPRRHLNSTTWKKNLAEISETQQSTSVKIDLKFSVFFFHVARDSTSHPTFNIIIIWGIFTDFFTFFPLALAPFVVVYFTPRK